MVERQLGNWSTAVAYIHEQVKWNSRLQAPMTVPYAYFSIRNQRTAEQYSSRFTFSFSSPLPQLNIGILNLETQHWTRNGSSELPLSL